MKNHYSVEWFKKLSNDQLLAISTGLVYLWFGLLKFFPETSPAEELAQNTIAYLTMGLIPENVSIVLLALLEVSIGLSLVFNICRKQMVFVALGHLVCTFTPLVFFPLDSFKSAPLIPTLQGQYIGKNIILMAALWVVFRKEVEKSQNRMIKNKS